MRRVVSILEFLLVFLMGVWLMHTAFAGSRTALAAEIGVPGHDSFYHIRMAAMLREFGVLREFPWLRFCYFTDEGQSFVSHHFGFHVLLAPFVELSSRLTGDALAGGRWAVMTFFGVLILLFYLLLKQERVPYRMLWLIMIVFLPFQFFTRHTFVRAISPSLAMMLALVMFQFRGRYILAGLTVLGFIQLYLGGVLFAPMIVGSIVVAQILGPRADRSWSWRAVLYPAVGWVLGLLVYPYSGGILEFLRLQVLGSGLSPDISVGQEWNPYENVWWFANMSGVLLCVWVLAIAARLRFGPVINARELSIFLISLTFLVLTLKARRFIEYWPVFAWLSSALLAAPLLRRFRFALGKPRADRWTGAFTVALFLGVVAAMEWTPLRRYLRLPGDAWTRIQRDARCQYDLPAVRAMMSFVQEHSQPGDVIFTDDWDIFPVFFYHNTFNHYIVGLDPKFTHHRRPDLWERYVKVSRGQVPSDVRFTRRDDSGKSVVETIHARLEDIRDCFGAKFVITDRDHEPLATKLAAAKHLAEFIFPGTSYADSRNAPFCVFRIRAENEVQEMALESLKDEMQEGVCFLSTMVPSSVEQGWGDLAADRSVGGGPIHVGNTVYGRGVGTHAPSKIEYRIPEGFDRFECVVGLDHCTRGKGSIIASVYLDGQEVFRSSILTGESRPERIGLPLGRARVLTLNTEATEDGNDFDHTDWADAKFVVADSKGENTPP